MLMIQRAKSKKKGWGGVGCVMEQGRGTPLTWQQLCLAFIGSQNCGDWKGSLEIIKPTPLLTQVSIAECGLQ